MSEVTKPVLVICHEGPLISEWSELNKAMYMVRYARNLLTKYDAEDLKGVRVKSWNPKVEDLRWCTGCQWFLTPNESWMVEALRCRGGRRAQACRAADFWNFADGAEPELLARGRFLMSKENFAPKDWAEMVLDTVDFLMEYTDLPAGEIPWLVMLEAQMEA